jgi:hypothetical protein
MGEIVGFVSKSERERIRLIREARAIYDSIFPPSDAVGELRVKAMPLPIAATTALEMIGPMPGIVAV